MVFGKSKKDAPHGMAEADANAAVESVPQGEVPDHMEKNVVLPSHNEELDEATAERRLRMFREAAANDPNIDINDLGHIDSAVAGHDAGKEHLLIDSLVENSPYPEVRAAVRNYDVDVPCNTVRAWVIGMFLTTLASGLNMLFSLRAESISISSYVAQLVSYPLGVGMAYILPNHQFNVFGLKFNFNPGPWNFKEHAIIVLMANASYGGGAAYFTDILTAQKVFFGMNLGAGYAILLGLTTQILGFSLAGMFRIWLVEPASMIWPLDLVNVAFMYALHDHSRTDPTTSNGWKIGRYRWFLYVFAASFCWYWIPGFIFQALSQFAFATWIAPNNVNVNKIFGTFTGMALLPITFDWTMVTAFTGSPLIPPWHALANIAISVVVFFWIVCAGWNWSGAFYSDYLPYSTSGSFDNTAQPYNVSMILTPDFRLDVEKYKAYSPLFLSTTFSMAYALSFAALPALILHTGLNYGKEIWLRWKDKNHDLDDIHARMMRKYNPVPNWWFIILFLISFALSFVTCYVWDTGLTWWAMIISIIIAVVWLLPIGIVQAVTNIQLGLNVFTEFLIGYMLPGRPTAMMMFKTYGYISMTQALSFIADMKLGHYLKLPPRTVFTAQVVATIWSTFVQVGVFYCKKNPPLFCRVV